MIEATRPRPSQAQPEDLGEFQGWDVYPMPMSGNAFIFSGRSTSAPAMDIDEVMGGSTT